MQHSFNQENQLTEIKKLEKQFVTEMPYHIRRWRKPSSFAQWKTNVNDFCDFVRKREPELKKQMKKYLE